MQRVPGIVVFFMLMILSSVVWAEEYQNVEVHKLGHRQLQVMVSR